MTADVGEHDAAGLQLSITQRRGEQLAQSGSVAGAVGAALTSAAAALCCIGPLALTLLGVNGMILAAGLKPYRFYLIGSAGLFLAAAFWIAYRPSRSVLSFAECPVPKPGTARLTRVVLWLTAGIWLASFILQFFADRVVW
ncbi:MAG: mercuric transporter MerT family protein [Gemmatimonadetes bacterium]|nr:mercuric transporter MerT family protein [Gemmatimonadota bacterium]